MRANRQQGYGGMGGMPQGGMEGGYGAPMAGGAMGNDPYGRGAPGGGQMMERYDQMGGGGGQFPGSGMGGYDQRGKNANGKAMGMEGHGQMMEGNHGMQNMQQQPPPQQQPQGQQQQQQQQQQASAPQGMQGMQGMGNMQQPMGMQGMGNMQGMQGMGMGNMQQPMGNMGTMQQQQQPPLRGGMHHPQTGAMHGMGGQDMSAMPAQGGMNMNMGMSQLQGQQGLPAAQNHAMGMGQMGQGMGQMGQMGGGFGNQGPAQGAAMSQQPQQQQPQQPQHQPQAQHSQQGHPGAPQPNGQPQQKMLNAMGGGPHGPHGVPKALPMGPGGPGKPHEAALPTGQAQGNLASLNAAGANFDGAAGGNGGNVNCYQQIVKLRQQQQAAGVDLSDLSAVQLGLFPIPRCHHITRTLQAVQGLPSYRVRICKRCSGGNAHIELGTYADQESAIIVNDAHEILYGRTSRLLVLVPGDEEYFGSLMLRRFCRGRIEMHRLTEVLREKLVVDAIKQSSRRKRAHDADKSEDDKMIVLQPLRERRNVITKAVEETCRKFVIPVLVSTQLGAGEEPEELLEQLLLEGFSSTTQFSKKLRRTPTSESDALEAAFASHLILFLGAYSSLSVTDLEDVTERILAVFPSTDKGTPNDQLYVNIEDFKEKSFSKLQALLDEGLRTLPVFCGAAVNMMHLLKTPRWLHRQQQGAGAPDNQFDPENAMHTCLTESALLWRFFHALPTARPKRVTDPEWASVEGNLVHCRSQVQHALARRAIVIGSCAVELQEKKPWTERLQLGLDTMQSVMCFMPDRSPVEQLEVRVVHCMLLDTLVRSLRKTVGHQPAGLTSQFREAIVLTLSLCKTIGLFSSTSPATPEAEQDAREALAVAEGSLGGVGKPLAKAGQAPSDPAIFQRSTNGTFDSNANNMQQEYRVLVLSVVLGFCSTIGECNLNMQLAEGIHLSSILREGADAAEWLEHICSYSDCCLLLSITGRAFLNATKTCLELAHMDANFGGLASSVITIAGTIFQFCATRFLYFEGLVAEANDNLVMVNERQETANKGAAPAVPGSDKAEGATDANDPSEGAEAAQL